MDYDHFFKFMVLIHVNLNNMFLALDHSFDFMNEFDQSTLQVGYFPHQIKFFDDWNSI